MNATYIEVSAAVRYWEDATVNGTEDTDGALIPMREGHKWAPVQPPALPREPPEPEPGPLKAKARK